MHLNADGTMDWSGLRPDRAPALQHPSATARWQLLAPPPAADADIIVTDVSPFYIGVAGSRRHPWLYLAPDGHDKCGLYRLTRT
jgi:hypothetical protein